MKIAAVRIKVKLKFTYILKCRGMEKSFHNFGLEIYIKTNNSHKN